MRCTLHTAELRVRPPWSSCELQPVVAMAAADVVDLTADDDDRGHGRDDGKVDGGDGDSDDGIRRRIRVLQGEIDQRRAVIRTLQRVLDERAEARLAVERDAVQRRFMSDGADGKRYPWTDELERARKDKFHLGHWRPMQKEICDAFLSGHDCLVFLRKSSPRIVADVPYCR